MKKSIELLEKALRETEDLYNYSANSVITYNKELEKLEEKFEQDKKDLYHKIDNWIENRNVAEKESCDIKKAITILQNYSLPEWGTKENKDEI